MNAPGIIRADRVRAFVAWLNTVEHPHWEQPGFADFADLTQAERLDAARNLEREAAARSAHPDKLEREVQRRGPERSGASPPESECPPAATEGQNIALGANAVAPYTSKGGSGNVISLPRALVEGTVLALIDALDRTDGDADSEVDPAESDGDDADTAWIEWQNLRTYQKCGPNMAAGLEDDELDDAPEDDDPDGEHDGREQDDAL